MCTVILVEVIAYYAAHGGSLYCTMLDATKAFDRVEYCKLFNGLLRRDIPGVYIRLLLNMYANHVTRVSWNGICSLPLVVGNDVKQGGVISSILFCIYIDSLRSANYGELVELRTTGKRYGPRSFRVAAPFIWNSLPRHLRNDDISREQFALDLKTLISVCLSVRGAFENVLFEGRFINGFTYLLKLYHMTSIPSNKC